MTCALAVGSNESASDFFRVEVLYCVFVCSLLDLHLATTNYSVEDKVLTECFSYHTRT